MQRLQKALLDDKAAWHTVDLFIADTASGIDTNTIKTPNYAYSIDWTQGKAQASYRHNGKTISADTMQTLFLQDDASKEELRTAYRQARKQNYEQIAELFKRSGASDAAYKLATAAAENRPYITVKLDAKTVSSLMKKAPEALTALDIHDDFAPAGANQEPHAGDSTDMAAWRARLGSYLDTTYVTQHQNFNYTRWAGTDIGIYYSDVECPATSEVTAPEGIYTGYTPITTEQYQILYHLNDPLNNGNIIDISCTNQSTLTACTYNLQTHTKIITGILSTVAPAANLLCKGAELDSNVSSYYENVLPTQNEMSTVSIESYSLNRYTSAGSDDSSRSYTPMDMVFDNHAFDYNVPVFIAAANFHKDNNPDNDVVSPAKAFNVITVGNYLLDENGLPLLNTSSSYHNPLLDGNADLSYQKPEISAPGTAYHALYQRYSDGTIYESFESNGTSFATPFTAAMTADLMSAIDHETNTSHFRQGPMYKAAMIALARDPVQVADTQGFDERYFRGEGGVDLSALPLYFKYVNANSRSELFTELVDGDRFCYSGWNDINISGSQHVRFVIAWFNRLSTHQITSIPNSYALEVLDPNGVMIARADTPNQGYQVVDFTLREAALGSYTARVCQTGIYDNNKVLLGFGSS
ncbi:MAG: S8 family serine peptidase [Campylobacterales bacterium]|nr:S8 family serine peptidase [Campylobacterales bacterium]